MKRWRSFGYQIILYLDDGWGCHSGEDCEKVGIQVKQDLEMAGFAINNDKSIWKPVSRLEWLGFIWDLDKGSIEIPLRKIVHLRSSIDFIQTSRLCTGAG